jgi:hypothetical protein
MALAIREATCRKCSCLPWVPWRRLDRWSHRDCNSVRKALRAAATVERCVTVGPELGAGVPLDRTWAAHCYASLPAAAAHVQTSACKLLRVIPS